MSAATLSYRHGVLPWAVAADDERRLRRILRLVLGAVLLIAIVVPWLPVAAPPPMPEPAALPLARVLLPPPPARKAEPLPPRPAAAMPRPAPVPAIVAERARPAPASVAAARHPVPGKPPGEDLAQARQRASGAGLLAMKDQLMQLAAAPVAVQLRADIRPGAGVGTGQGPGVGAGREAGAPTRAMITAAAGRGSGGIASGNVSRDTGGGGLAGRSTTLVEGQIGGGGGGGPGGGAGGGSAPAGDGRGQGTAPAAIGGSVQRSGAGKASRSIEEIRLVFERHKGAIHALYNRALRDAPALQGKVVLELKIAPSGAVDAVRLISSELGAAELEGKLLARVRMFDFGAKDVEVMVVSWPVDFLPS